MKPIIRCSSLNQLLSCPGSRTLTQKLHEDFIDFDDAPKGNAMTWRGNWCHYESAMQLCTDHGAIAPNGLPPPVLGAGWKPSAWEERTVEWFVANLLANTPANHAIFVEREIKVEFRNFILSGHLDVHTLSPDGTEADVDDLKSGLGEVDIADENWQLAGYAVLLKCYFRKLEKVRARIFQRDADAQISETVIDDLNTLVKFLEGKINEALANPCLLETGAKQCKFCECVEFCPAIHEEIKRMKLILTPERIAALNVVPELPVLADVVHAGRAITGPIDRLIDRLKERIEAEGPTQLPDGTPVRLVEEPGRRSVTHPRAAFEVLTPKLGTDAAWETLSVSLTATEDELVKSGMKRTSTKGESAKGWIEEHMKHLIVRPTVKKLLFK